MNISIYSFLIVSALMLAIERQMRPDEALRFAAAAAGASVMRPGTLLCRREDAEKLLPEIKVEKLV